MDILKVLVNDLADGSIIRDEDSKTQTPNTPVAAHLTNNELTFRLGLDNSLVNLLQWVDALVIHLLQSCLGINCDSKQNGQEYCNNSTFLHKTIVILETTYLNLAANLSKFP